MIDSLHRYATDMLQDFNPFDFVASAFYYTDCWPCRILEWSLAIASALIIGHIDPLGGLAATAAYLLAYVMRNTCAVCDSVAGIGICIAAVASVLGKFGFISAFLVFCGYLAVFLLWLGLVYWIWRRG